MTTKQETVRRRRKGIPAYIFVPGGVALSPREEQRDGWSSARSDDDDESLSSLEEFEDRTARDYRKQDQATRRLRTKSLPAMAFKTVTCFNDSDKTCFNNDSSTDFLRLSSSISKFGDHHSLQVDDHMDRPPKAPERRRSIQTSSSCPLSLVMIGPTLPSHSSHNIRRALAA